MAAFAGLMHHSLTAGQALQGQNANPMNANPMTTAGAAPAAATTSSGSSSATISANDFLTLLVTEMQNQDPTAQTDPNEYINQLVQVNSLEQLIDINQNLSTVLGTTPSATHATAGASKNAQPAAPASSLTAPAGAAPSHPAAGHAANQPHRPMQANQLNQPNPSGTQAAISRFAQSVGNRSAPGNLGIPAADPAAHRVAHALDGHAHPPARSGKPAKST